MTDTTLARYFEGRREALIALGNAVVHPHLGLAGAARETLIRLFLKDHLPPILAVGSGQIVGHEWVHGEENRISRQQDIVIYRHDMPVLTIGDSPLYFKESVVATIEVKTEYTATDLDSIFENAHSVQCIETVPAFTFQMACDGPVARSSPRRILSGVFYFRGPKTRTTLVNNLNALLAGRASDGSLTDVPGPDFFLSAEAGLIVRNEEFNTLFASCTQIEGRDAVHGNLQPTELIPGAYRRVFGDLEKWRAFAAVVLELAERCQRYAVSYASLSKYV
jgi:hypothetical protein